MPPKKGIGGNVIETLGEPVRTIKGDVKKQVEAPIDLIRMLYVDPGHKFKTEEELEQIEQRERMEKLEGFKQSIRELNAMQGKVVSEEIIDEAVRKQIEEEERRLSESFQRFEATSRDTASSLGQTQPSVEKQIEQQGRLAQEEKRKKAEEKQRLEAQVEAPAGKQIGLSFKGRRKSNPRRGTPRATAKLRSAESKLGQGVGG